MLFLAVWNDTRLVKFTVDYCTLTAENDCHNSQKKIFVHTNGKFNISCCQVKDSTDNTQIRENALYFSPCF